MNHINSTVYEDKDNKSGISITTVVDFDNNARLNEIS